MLGLVVSLYLARPLWVRALGGASQWRSVRGGGQLSAPARDLLDRVYGGIDPERLFDFHCHLAGIGRGSDCWVNPRMLSPWHVRDHVRLLFYMSAGGVRDADAADESFVAGLFSLARAEPLPGRRLLLAFDHRYAEDGELDLEGSEFYVPNAYVYEAARSAPEIFEACASIHPYRVDAIEELELWAQRGVRFVKWLPNAMGIDPADPRCDAFYRRMRELDVTLLSHTGEEQAVDAEGDQELGNPLRLRRALDAGVRVFAAHCGSLGSSRDLDGDGARRSNFDLFLRLMDEPRYEGLLYGEISTVTQVNRFAGVLDRLLERTDLHARLVNGSDWPLPGVNVLFQTRALLREGFLSAEERRLLNELYDHDPLLFDLALKRTVKAPGSGARFAPTVFEAPRGLPVKPRVGGKKEGR